MGTEQQARARLEQDIAECTQEIEYHETCAKRLVGIRDSYIASLARLDMRTELAKGQTP